MTDEVISQYEANLSAAVSPDYFLQEQFCNAGTNNIDYVIPPVTSVDPSAASLETGAPPLQQVKPSLGGAVFPRQQYNGILRLISNIIAFLNKGNLFTFDTKNTAGYANGAVLFDYATNRFVVSLHDANTANFVTNPTLINGTDWKFITFTPESLLSSNNTWTGTNTFNTVTNIPNGVINSNIPGVATNYSMKFGWNGDHIICQVDNNPAAVPKLAAVNYNNLFTERQDIINTPYGSKALTLNSTSVGLFFYTGGGLFASSVIRGYDGAGDGFGLGFSGAGNANLVYYEKNNSEIATLANLIGVNQIWQNLSSVRSAGVLYTNTTGKPIGVSVIIRGSALSALTVNGVDVSVFSGGSASTRISLSAIIPPNGTYSVYLNDNALDGWSELR